MEKQSQTFAHTAARPSSQSASNYLYLFQVYKVQKSASMNIAEK